MKSDVELAYLSDIVGQIGNTVVSISETPIPLLSRIYCLQELLSTDKHGGRVGALATRDALKKMSGQSANAGNIAAVQGLLSPAHGAAVGERW